MRFGQASARFLGMVGIFALPLLSGCASDAANGTDDNLVGGKVADQNAFPSVFRFTNQTRTCTGVKVGPNHILTAAHCVTQTGKSGSAPVADPKLGPGQLLLLARRSFDTDSHEHIIRDTYIHPSHLAATVGTGQADLDLAVIITQEPLEEFTSASVDRDAVAKGQALTILGYGCAKNDTTTSNALRYGDSKSVDSESTASALKLPSSAPLSAFYTEGSGTNASAPSICDGDSGGAVFRKGTTRVVGVNAKGYGSPATFNAHARVDGKTSLGVAAWLTSLGVTVSPACTKETCVAAPATTK